MTATITKEPIERLISKVRELKENEYLYTTFGPSNAFSIEKGGVLKVWNVYHSFEYRPIETAVIENETDLSKWLKSKPTYYARNYFSQRLVHFDNWIKLVNAFKVREYNGNEKYAEA